jgi:L-threonylcarbamoyladenylate synthase
MKTFNLNDPEERKFGFTAASAAAKRGELVVLPTDTVYGLGTDAFNHQGIERLLKAKGRQGAMPTPVLIGSPNALPALALKVDKRINDLVQCFWPGALTLIVKQQPTLNWDLGDTNGTIAIRMPMHPVAIELLNLVGPMAVASANKIEQQPATTVEAAIEQFQDVVSIYLDTGKSPINQPSTILDLTGEKIRAVRVGAIELEEICEIVGEVEVPDGKSS